MIFLSTHRVLITVFAAALLCGAPAFADGATGDQPLAGETVEAVNAPSTTSSESVDASIGKAEHSAVKPRGAGAVEKTTLQNASGERLAEAVGHYARARALLIAAIREYDLGYEKARPDALINSKLFRDTLLDRAEELERVLDPQPRITRGGVRYSPDSRLLSEAKRRK